MRAVIQRVSRAAVLVNGQQTGEIGAGFLVLLGVGQDDNQRDVAVLAEKISRLRVFSDSDGKMNLCLSDVQGAVLLVSQFTLFGDCRKGRRPSFTDAAAPEVANELYLSVAAELRGHGIPVEMGRFQAHMEVSLVNDGPVTLLLDSKKRF